MPTAKPRVNVAMDQADFDLLSAFAASQGVSRASVLVELWQMAAPVMARVLKLVQEAERAKASVKDGIREAAIEAELRVAPLHREMLLNFDMFEEAIRDVIMEAGGISDPAGAGGGVRSATPPADDGEAMTQQPPSSNTGVRFRKGRGVAVPDGVEKPSNGKASSDARAGMVWWNGLSEQDRASWCDRAGTAVPAEAWKYAKSIGAL